MTKQKKDKTKLRGKSICVFCGASQHVALHFFELANECGKTIAENGYNMVYGGGSTGLMGTAALAAHHAGGKVLGIIPKFLTEIEVLLETIEHIVVDDMHERKRLMYEKSDAFIVLPGGIGTLEEAVEIMSWMRLHLHAKPIIFVDTDGYWKPLMDLLHHTIASNFSPTWVKGHLLHETTPAAALKRIQSHWDNPPNKGEIQISDKIVKI